MTSLTSQDGKLVVRDGKLGTEQACCCDAVSPGNACCECQEVTFLEGIPTETFATYEAAETRFNELRARQEAAVVIFENYGWVCASGTSYFIQFNEQTNLWEVGHGPYKASCCGSYNVPFDPTIYEDWYNNGGDFPVDESPICTPGEVWENATCYDSDNGFGFPATQENCGQECQQFRPGESCETADCENPLP